MDSINIVKLKKTKPINGYNYIGIDPSINSTGVVVNGTVLSFCSADEIYTKSGKLGKWYNLSSSHIYFSVIDYTYKSITEYSKCELKKTEEYGIVTQNIIDTIKKIIDTKIPTKVFIEGYSYGSGSDSSIIDLVNFSSLLRDKLLRNITTDITIVAPTTLKLSSCKMTYEPINEGKKKEKMVYRNDIGIAGGDFSKCDMFYSLIQNKTFNNLDYIKHLNLHKDEITKPSKIPKPYEDCDDAFTLFLCGLSELI